MFILKRYTQVIVAQYRGVFLVLLFTAAIICTNIFPAFSNSQFLQEGKLLYENGRFTEAVQVLQQAAKIYQQQGDNLRQAATLSNLSLAYQQLGAWREAQSTIASSLSLLGYRGNTVKIQNPAVVAPTLDIQGRLQLAKGQTENALATWQQAAEIYQKADDKIGVVRSRINQVQALRTLGNYRNAVKILASLEKTLQALPDSQEKAVGLRSLGDILASVGDTKSRSVLEQSLQISQRLKLNTDISASLFSLGNYARTQQKHQEAIAFYQQVAQISPSLLTKVQAQINHLNILVASGQIAPAQNLASEISTQLDQLPPSRSAIYARINFAENFSRLNLSNPQPQILATAIQQARTLGDKRAEAYALGSLGSLYEKSQQWTEAQKLTQDALILAQASNSPEITYKWQWQLGRLLQKQGDNPKAIASYDAAVDTLASLRSDLVALNKDVQFSFRDTVEPVYRESVELLLQSQPDTKTLEKARQRIEALQLAELDNFFREACLQGQTVLLDQIVDKENPTTAILYPIILSQQLHVIVKIPKQPLRHYTTNISQTDVEKTVTQLRQNLVRPAAIKAVKTQSQKIYNWLIQPIESQLAQSQVDTLVFVLDGALRNLPMAVLYNGNQYLIEKYAIALNLGLQLQNPKPLTKEKLNALTAGLTEPPPQYPNLAPLPAIKTEFDLIAQAGVSTTTLIDQQFTSKALETKVSTLPFNVLHLATHGQFSSQREKTYILAADGPINVTQFDTLLRSGDETRTESVQLLVLSACQTASGDNRATLGLAGVALKAGARSTVASLWQIDDESTAQFIGEFYRELKGQNSKAEALRRAQLKLLQHPNYKSPGYWSSYVLIGNWL